MNVKEIIFDKISQEKVIAKEAKEDSDLYRDLGFDSLSFIRLLFEICLLYTSPSPRDCS